MANKSSKSPTGEEREQQNEHVRDQGVEKEDIKKNSPVNSKTQKPAKQENLTNRGFQEDQPQNPIRGTGSVKKHQESLPTGEPDPNGN